MPWRTQTVIDERVQFAVEASKSIRSFAGTCRRFGISRPTGHKWLKRYQAGGVRGLADQSRRPRSCSHAVAQPVVDRILELRRQFDLGARKIQRFLREEFDTVPCVDTIHNVLKRHGCVERPKPRRRQSHPGPPPTSMDHPNDVWTADFKGELKTGNGRYCYPLTIRDGYSRYLLDCCALSRLDLRATTASFHHLFRTLGLPNRIRIDNGPPFASRAIGRLSQLSVGWIKLGIRPELIEPGKPYQNGRHERMHRTLGERQPSAVPRTRRARAHRRRRLLCLFRPRSPGVAR